MLQPEHRVVLGACRAALGIGLQPVRDAAAEHFADVPAMATRHAVVPLVYRGLAAAAAAGTTDVPPNVLGELRARFDENALHNIEHARHLVELGTELAAHDIPFMPIKGPTLAVAAYGDLAMRQFGDIDLLVHRRDVARACTLLRAGGFRLAAALPPSLDAVVADTEYHVALEHPEKRVALELHWALGRRGFGRLRRDDWAWANARTVSLLGRQLPVLSWEAQMVYLSAHGVKHGWTQLAWVCDLAASIRTAPHPDWDGVRALAAAAGVSRMLEVGLGLCALLLGQDLAGLGWRETPDAGVAALTEASARRCLSPQLSTAREDLVFQLRARERLADRIAYGADVLTSPHIADIQSAALPAPLGALYYALRPLRLAVKHTRAALARRRASVRRSD